MRHQLHYGYLLPFIVPLLSAYTYFIVKQKKPGLRRLLWALPVLALQILLPWSFDQSTEPVFLAVAFCIVTWLGGFRVSTFCAGRGVLTSAWAQSSFLRFYLANTLPLQLGPPMTSGNLIKDETPRASRPSITKSKLLTNPVTLIGQTTFKVLLFSLVQNAYTIPGLSPAARDAAFAVGLFLFVTALTETGSALLMLLLDLEIQPHFNQPYLAESFQSFWARRWNLTVSCCFRESVYEPVLEFLLPELKKGQTPKKDLDRARLSAMFATFLVSGLLHELAMYYLSSRVTGEMLAFFLLQFLFIYIELQLRSAGLLNRVPELLCRVTVVGITFLSAHLLFFAAAHRTGVTSRIISQVQSWFQR